MITNKLENIFKIRIFIFDFKFLLSILSLLLLIGLKFFFLSDLFVNKIISQFKSNSLNLKLPHIPKIINIQNINKNLKELEKKIKIYFDYLSNIQSAINYLPIKTILYVPKNEIQKNLKETKKIQNQIKKINVSIKRSIFKRKITLYVDLYSLIYISKKSSNNIACLIISTNERYKSEGVCLRKNMCTELRQKNIKVCISKIYSDKVKIKIKIGDNSWEKVIYPGLNTLYLEY